MSSSSVAPIYIAACMRDRLPEIETNVKQFDNASNGQCVSSLHSEIPRILEQMCREDRRFKRYFWEDKADEWIMLLLHADNMMCQLWHEITQDFRSNKQNAQLMGYGPQEMFEVASTLDRSEKQSSIKLRLRNLPTFVHPPHLYMHILIVCPQETEEQIPQHIKNLPSEYALRALIKCVTYNDPMVPERISGACLVIGLSETKKAYLDRTYELCRQTNHEFVYVEFKDDSGLKKLLDKCVSLEQPFLARISLTMYEAGKIVSKQRIISADPNERISYEANRFITCKRESNDMIAMFPGQPWEVFPSLDGRWYWDVPFWNTDVCFFSSLIPTKKN